MRLARSPSPMFSEVWVAAARPESSFRRSRFESVRIGSWRNHLHRSRMRLMRWKPQVLGQILHVDRGALRHHAGMAEYVLQFPHIAGKTVAREHNVRPLREPANILAELRGKMLDEKSNQQRQIFLAIGQRW